MGLLKLSDWSAQWISFRDSTPLHAGKSLYLPPPRQYRKSFQASRIVRRAVLYTSALGLVEWSLNGRLVSDALFVPGWSDYRKRAYYRTFDVTGLITRGGNTLDAILADGWYAGYVGFGLRLGYGPEKSGRAMYGKTPALLGQLEIEYTDGSRETIATDGTWQVGTGPILEADLLMGETYDARREPGNWQPAIRAEDNGGIPAKFYDASGRRAVDVGFKAPVRLQAYPAPPVRAVGKISPVAITRPDPSVFIYDLGQNFAGVARLKVKGPAGAVVRLRFGEMLHSDGTLMTENLGRARATDTYILRGDPAGESFTPRFTYHGFRYVEVTGFPGTPGLDAITGIAIQSDTPLSSSFESSDEMANRLFRNIVWTQRSNFIEVPTDCPQRDERLGWTGDAQIYASTAMLNADTAAFYTKWLDDLEEAQRDNGAFPDYAPYPMQVGSGKATYGAAWTDAGVIVPYQMYRAYGDRRVIERHWSAMSRFMNFRRSAKPGNAWGDWLAIGANTPIGYISAVYAAYDAKLMSEMAAAIGRHGEAQQYRDEFAGQRAKFRADYMHGCVLSIETQTAYALALQTGLMPDQCRGGDQLARLIAENGNRMATGFLGTPALLPALSASGHHDLALGLFASREFPSWGYEVARGATTIWERWNAVADHSDMNSFNHYAFGAVADWMFRSVAGIDEEGAGYKRIVLRPDETSLDWVNAQYCSIRGTIVTRWRRSADGFDLEVTIPPNTTATVEMPAVRPLSNTRYVKCLRVEDGRAILEVQSGTYRFRSPLVRLTGAPVR